MHCTYRAASDTHHTTPHQGFELLINSGGADRLLEEVKDVAASEGFKPRTTAWGAHQGCEHAWEWSERAAGQGVLVCVPPPSPFPPSCLPGSPNIHTPTCFEMMTTFTVQRAFDFKPPSACRSCALQLYTAAAMCYDTSAHLLQPLPHPALPITHTPHRACYQPVSCGPECCWSNAEPCSVQGGGWIDTAVLHPGWALL